MAKKKVYPTKVFRTNPDTIAINVQQFTDQDPLFPYPTGKIEEPPYCSLLKRGASVLGPDNPKERKKGKG